MAQTENIFRKSTISYQDYLLSVNSEEEYLDNEWGWFVDVEIETPDLSTRQNIVNTDKKLISILPTISERKSDTDLYESVDVSPPKISKSSSSSSLMVHATCLISIIYIFMIM
jgi:hypothetical protein